MPNDLDDNKVSFCFDLSQLEPELRDLMVSIDQVIVGQPLDRAFNALVNVLCGYAHTTGNGALVLNHMREALEVNAKWVAARQGEPQ